MLYIILKPFKYLIINNIVYYWKDESTDKICTILWMNTSYFKRDNSIRLLCVSNWRIGFLLNKKSCLNYWNMKCSLSSCSCSEFIFNTHMYIVRRFSISNYTGEFYQLFMPSSQRYILFTDPMIIIIIISGKTTAYCDNNKNEFCVIFEGRYSYGNRPSSVFLYAY